MNGTNLEGASSVNFRTENPDAAAAGITTRVTSSTETQVVAEVSIADDDGIGSYNYLVSVTTPNGTSNALQFDINHRFGAFRYTNGIEKYFKHSKSRNQRLAQSSPASGIVLTPVADGTVQQLMAKSPAPGAFTAINTTGPATIAQVVQVQGAPFDTLNKASAFNFQRYGLGTGGALNFSGTSQVKDFARSLPVPPSGNASVTQASFGAAGILEFDLNSLKTALQQSSLPTSAVRATLRLTPIRSLSIFDLMTNLSLPQVSATTQVALLDMAQNQKDLVVDYKDFPGFTSPRVSTLNNLAGAINTAPTGRRAIVRTDLLGMLVPINFDVTQALQRDLQGNTPTTGFQIVSELNGTGLIFADSSMQIPGISDSIVPQLIIEIAGLAPPSKAQFIASATKIPFDSVATGSTDMMLVTVNNIGASSGTITLDLTSDSNGFGLITVDGKPLNAQGNSAVIEAGDRLTFGVTFKPGDGESFQDELQLTDTTIGNHDVFIHIALTGSTLGVNFNPGIPPVTAPLKPQRLPDQAARVGDLNGDGILDAVDISELSAIIAGRVLLPSLGTTAFAIADINGDGAINSADARILADVVARNLNSLPRLTPSASEIRKPNRSVRRPTEIAVATQNPPPSRRTGAAAVPRCRR